MIETRHIDDIEFNEEMIDVPTIQKIIQFYEARKLEVLQKLSNPFIFKNSEKENFVLELAVE